MKRYRLRQWRIGIGIRVCGRLGFIDRLGVRLLPDHWPGLCVLHDYTAPDSWVPEVGRTPKP